MRQHGPTFGMFMLGSGQRKPGHKYNAFGVDKAFGRAYSAYYKKRDRLEKKHGTAVARKMRFSVKAR